MKKRGFFITFEGVDGCGKSTQAKLLSAQLSSEHSVVTTREPGGTMVAEKIRTLLIDPANGSMVDDCELLLYLAARAQHVQEIILPALERGEIIICDRFQDATFAYQGFGRDISLETLKTLNTFATGGLLPDLTFIFDISIDTAFDRLAAMNKPRDRLESGGRSFFEKIRQGYQILAEDEPERIILFDGNASPEILAEMVWNKVTAVVEKHSNA
jgi:dTMP kinase